MELASQLRTSLAAQSLPPASTSFLTTLIGSRTPPPPIASLLATAKARLLACDLTSSSSSSSSSSILDAAAVASLPGDIGSARVEERTLPRDVHVQVVDVENLSLSRWEQVEELEAVARGERTRGREVVRVTADDDDDGENAIRAAGTQSRGGGATQQPAAAGAARNAVHRLVLQDSKGRTVYAVEMKRMDRIGVGKTNIGEKMLLKAGTVVARGSVLLTPDKTVFLGGKVEAWHEAWMNGRLARLKAAVGADRPQ
ncbi:hypothetical protein LEL_01538 [Akanthomyces lecanii RCEF 1005]|uniref:Uncharacterized protein n=1 Tax=Akanthomyces lecanii RCEF 1005 TaxID=1081108 RepID=A0A168KQ32_CORDF|nr:hypothetical protein LEL_01538 [Akanthomyces lecanii RCEF 1005]